MYLDEVQGAESRKGEVYSTHSENLRATKKFAKYIGSIRD